MYKQLIDQLPRTAPYRVFEEYDRMLKIMIRRGKLSKLEQEYWEALNIRKNELVAAGITKEKLRKVSEGYLVPVNFPSMKIPKEFKDLYGELSFPKNVKNEPKKCICASRDLFHFGCRCGGL